MWFIIFLHLFSLHLMFLSFFSFIFIFLLQDYGKCPVIKESLTIDDIIPIKTRKVSFHFEAILLISFSIIFQNIILLKEEGMCASPFGLKCNADSEVSTSSRCMYSQNAGNVSNSTCQKFYALFFKKNIPCCTFIQVSICWKSLFLCLCSTLHVCFVQVS